MSDASINRIINLIVSFAKWWVIGSILGVIIAILLFFIFARYMDEITDWVFKEKR